MMKPQPIYSAVQKHILQILMQAPEKTTELTAKLGKNRTTVKYHIDRLLRDRLIQTRTLMQVGGAKINEISIDKLALHKIRQILGMKSEGITLLTGFGELETGYLIPDISYSLLLKELKNEKIDKILCFITNKALEIRQRNEQQDHLLSQKLFTFYPFDYNSYRSFNTDAFKKLEEVILTELEKRNVILDLTPLSKLFSFRLLEYSDKYNIPSFYLGKTLEGKDTLIWFRK